MSVFEKFNIDKVGITDASLYNAVTGKDFKSVIVALFMFAINYRLCYYAQEFKPYGLDVLAEYAIPFVKITLPAPSAGRVGISGFLCGPFCRQSGRFP